MLKATLELIYINKMEKDIFFNVADIVKRAKRVLNFKNRCRSGYLPGCIAFHT